MNEAQTTFEEVLGFLRHPLPENATAQHCGFHANVIGGHFNLSTGKMRKSNEEFKSARQNRKCDRVGQTAAIRVNMTTREARLFVDDEEQPGIFTDIPSPLCLAITTGFTAENRSVEVMWLKRLRGFDELERAGIDEWRTLELENETLNQQLADLPIWVGTKSIRTLDRAVHALTPTTLTQIIVTPTDNPWRTAFTVPVEEGAWELKVRASENTFWSLGFIGYPLPQNATQYLCGSWLNGIGGDFILRDGGMWKNGEKKQLGTNQKCDRVGQTAAIRVNMMTREARLFVDDEEQPGIFTDIPSPLCLAVSTDALHRSVEVLWLKRLRSCPII
ncbi:hypothetical protein BLNAU_15736 [Blattamonas nauphoetae]|uniref:Uncharacterized protein n=1 Tax=Blattamonas nauphoetae TaxID=2049346 RepID=A0ABQ9X9Y6_9EUKA|nr:hypothetical protein BLNAU_15736 [Blattamonas nauphoetae]